MTDTTEVTAADGSKYFVYKGIITDLATVEPSAAEIAAMETLIADEYALETAFEGSRFFDLMRLRSTATWPATTPKPTLGSHGAFRVAISILFPYEEPTKTGALFGKC